MPGNRIEKFYVSREYMQYCEMLATEWNLLHSNRCFFCGISFDEQNPATKDHLYPRSRGGHETVNACRRCNQAKSATSLHRFRIFVFGCSNKPFYAEIKMRTTPPLSCFLADKEIEAIRMRMMENTPK